MQVWASYRFYPTVCATYSPTRANEFPNDNPALHEGARWVCRRPLGAPRALLQAPPGSSRRVELAAELPPLASAPAEHGPPSALAAPASAGRSVPPLAAAEPEARFAGPLELDLARIVLPHRVADIPPPPDFIFRPLASSRRPETSLLRAPFTASAAPPLTLLGYRVVDARVAASRVERRWRVDIAPCLHVVAPPAELAPPVPEVAAATVLPVPEVVAATELPLLAGAAPAELPPPEVTAATELPLPEAAAATELESLAQALFPEASMASEPAILEPLAPPGSEPPAGEHPVSEQCPASERAAIGLAAAILEPPLASEAPASKKKQQRRRAARVASSAALAVAASAGNAELTRTLAEVETAFAERRSEQPSAARKRRSRRAAPKAAKPAGMAVAGMATAVATPDADEAPRRRAANAV